MNLFKLFGIISINNSDANRSIDDTSGRAGKLAVTFGKIGKAAVVGIGAAATAVGSLMKSSISGYAEYEQLVGGVETLFKDSSGKVQQYAANAYKTAGLSANDYMSTVTSFSASLLQSMKGDTAAAADIANMALSDMSDNANKMGTSMSSIQDAYQGFAKQNYTMLDNLKLGYGGTKTEMQRLLKDAQKISGVKYNIKNLDDVYEAIHVIQNEMGITGTTALEASETISGSFASAGAAWKNLLVGIADGNQDISQLMNNFVGAGKTAVRNVTKLLPDLVEGVQGLVQGIAPEIPGIVQAIFPALLNSAISLIGSLAAAIPGLLSVIGSTLSTAWSDTVWPAIQKFFKINFDVTFPDWNSGVSAIIATGWNDIVWPAIQDFFRTFFLVDMPDWETITTSIGTAWTAMWNENIVDWFQTTFGVNLPDWETIAADINAGWEKVKSLLTDMVIDAKFHMTHSTTVRTQYVAETQGAAESSGASVEQATGSSFLGELSKTIIQNSTVNPDSPWFPTWRAEGAIFKKATIFNTRLGYQGVGEAGEEAVAPISLLRQYVREEVEFANARNHDNGMKEEFQAFAEALPDMLMNAFASMKFDVNNREFARMVKAVT